MASASFRDSINSLGWTRREPELPISTGPSSDSWTSRLASINPFRNDYIQLPTTEPSSSGAPLPAPSRREEEEAWFALSRWDRMMIFGACNLGAAACFVICFSLFPILATRPRKFVILWNLGSLLFMGSFVAMTGVKAQITHLLSAARLPFTCAYFGSIFLTLLSALWLRSTILTLLCAIIQIGCSIYYLVSYFPMGATGLRYLTSFGTQQAMSWMRA